MSVPAVQTALAAGSMLPILSTSASVFRDDNAVDCLMRAKDRMHASKAMAGRRVANELQRVDEAASGRVWFGDDRSRPSPRSWETQVPVAQDDTFNASCRAAYAGMRLQRLEKAMWAGLKPFPAGPASLRHVPTAWAVRTGRRTSPTLEDTMMYVDPVADPDRAHAEDLIRMRRFHRYGDYVAGGDSRSYVSAAAY